MINDQSNDMKPIQNPLDKNEKELPKQTQKNLDNKKIPKTEKKIDNYKQNSTTRSKKKSPHRQSSRLRNQPRKDYKTFIPQSKLF